jgi:hypothetical protein
MLCAEKPRTGDRSHPADLHVGFAAPRSLQTPSPRRVGHSLLHPVALLVRLRFLSPVADAASVDLLGLLVEELDEQVANNAPLLSLICSSGGLLSKRYG